MEIPAVCIVLGLWLLCAVGVVLEATGVSPGAINMGVAAGIVAFIISCGIVGAIIQHRYEDKD